MAARASAPALSIRAPSAPARLPARAKALLSAFNAYPVFVTDERDTVVRHGGIKTAVLALLSFVLVVGILSWLFTVGSTVTTVVENPTLAQYDAISARQPSCPCKGGGITTLSIAADLNPAGYAATHSMARSLCGAITRLITAAQSAGKTQWEISTAFPPATANYEAAFVQNEITRGVGGFCLAPSYSEELSLKQAQSTVVPLDFLASRAYIQSLAAQVYKQYFMNTIILAQSMQMAQSISSDPLFFTRLVRSALDAAQTLTATISHSNPRRIQHAPPVPHGNLQPAACCKVLTGALCRRVFYNGPHGDGRLWQNGADDGPVRIHGDPGRH